MAQLITRDSARDQERVDRALTSDGRVIADRLDGPVPTNSTSVVDGASVTAKAIAGISQRTYLLGVLEDLGAAILRRMRVRTVDSTVDGMPIETLVMPNGSLAVAGTVATVTFPAAGMANPMTTPADIIVGGTAGAPNRLAKGASGQVLTVDPTTGLLAYATPATGGMADPTTTKGDLLARNATILTRLPVGTDGQVLTVDGVTATGLKWAAAGGAVVTGGWSSVIGVSGTALVGGEYLAYEVPFACTLTAVRAWSPVTGSATVTVSRATYAALPTFTALGSLALSATNKAADTTLTGWTAVAIAAGDWLHLQITGTPATIDQLHIGVQYTRS